MRDVVPQGIGTASAVVVELVRVKVGGRVHVVVCVLMVLLFAASKDKLELRNGKKLLVVF